MANLPLAFIEIVLGGVILDAGIKGASIADVVKGEAKQNPISGLTGSSAGGGSGGSGSTATGKGSNLFPDGFVPNRLDAGFDGTFKNRIVAPASGTVMFAATGVPSWGGYIVFKLDQKIAGLPSQYLYFAEGVQAAPGIHNGSHVNAGQTFAVPAVSPYGNSYGQGATGAIEWGLAQPTTVGNMSDPLAHAYGAGSAQAKAVVLALEHWAESLGIGKSTDEGNAGIWP